jgi:CubicO group peptidase (beta-lactamase class C family)
MNSDVSRRSALKALLAASAATGSGGSASAGAAGDWAAVGALASKAVADRVVPGVAICVRRGGKTIFEAAYGAANIETGARMRPDTICRVGSVTKQFTAAAILLLAQEGKLNLDDPMSRFLPDFPRGKDITLDRMLTHTSGLADYIQAGSRAEVFRFFRTDLSNAEMLDYLRHLPKLMIFEPGTSWTYSSTGYVLLGIIIEQLTGQRVEEVFRERLFGPAGMTNTAVDHAADVVPGRASGYTFNGKAASGFDNAAYVSMSVPATAGNMRSTARDLCAWHEALLAGRILSAPSLKAMLTPARLNDGSFPKEGHLGPALQPIRYGYGQSLVDLTGRPCVLHGGNIPGFLTDLRTYRDTGLTQAVIINIDGNPRSGKLMDDLPLAVSRA